MKTKHTIRNASQLATRLQRLRKIRRKRIIQIRVNREKRQTLTKNQRDKIFMKTDGRCHICGGKIFKDEAWQADHVIAHAQGGTHKTGNYLPAHEFATVLGGLMIQKNFNGFLNLVFGCEHRLNKKMHEPLN